MDSSQYGLWISLIALFPVGSVLDRVVTPKIRKFVSSQLQAAALFAQRPFSARFYCCVCCGSILLIGTSILVVGGIESLQERTDGFRSAAHSIGPLVMALLCKIFLIDYVLALKSAVLWEALSNQLVNRIKKMAFLAGDILLSVFVTAAGVHGLESIQTNQMNHASNPAVSIVQFIVSLFKEVDLFTKYAVQLSLYWLNGSLIFYACRSVAWIATPSRNVLDWLSIEDIPFKVITALLTGIGFVIGTCIWFASSH